MTLQRNLSKRFVSYFDTLRFFGDDGEGGEGEGGEGGGSGNGQWDGKFTPEQQAKVDEIVKKRLGKERTDKENLISQLRSLQETAKLTNEEKENLSSQISSLESSLMTEQEKAAKVQKDLTEKHSKELKSAMDQSTLWQNRYTESTLMRSITDAAVSSNAENPQQIVAMFRGSSRLEPEVDSNGKETGNFIPHMKFQGLDEDGNQKEFDLPIVEAVAKLRQDGLNKNLFKHDATSGTGTLPNKGGTGAPKDGPPRKDDYKSDAEFGAAYREWRKTHDLSEI